MDFNKVAAGILFAGIIFVGTLIISEGVFSPDKLEKQAYIIDTGIVQTTDADAPQKPAYLMGEEFAALVGTSDPAKGEKLFKKCVACHSNQAGAANKIGPNLWGVFQKDIAAVDGYTYSAALTTLEGNWEVDSLNGWLFKPRAYAKGNRMGFAGIKDDEQRASMIAYLKTLQ
ncbi:MAG: cytochrome c [Alphaproteobacteria bacterium]|jgi:cytochrome c